MTTVAPSAKPSAKGSAKADRAARLGLVDAVGASLAELNDAPQTIGGGPRCSVRLGAAGLRPLHCVITPGVDGPVVRRWAADTHLNGHDFTEAALSPGDLLRIGSIDLRVVELPSELPAYEQPEPAPVQNAVVEEAIVEEAAAVPALAKKDTAPAELISATPITSAPVATEAEWLDDGVTELSTTPPVAAPIADFDPAIPSRLLRPWAPVEPAAEVATDIPAEPLSELGAASEVPFAALSGLQDAVEEAFGPTLEQLAFVEEAPVASGWETDASIDPWRVEPVAPAKATDAIPTFDPAAAATFSVETSTPAVPAIDNATIQRLRSRAQASRVRIARLVTMIRVERQQVADLTGVVTDLASQLEQALAASDEASAELARLANERTKTSHDLVAVREALAEATSRAEKLESQVAELEVRLAAAPVVLAPVEVVNEFANPTEPVVESPAEPDWSTPQWRQEADEVPVFAGEVLDDSVEPMTYEAENAEAGEEDPFAWRTLPEAEAAEAADEPLWGIERLAATRAEEPAATDSPWAGLATEQPAAEPQAEAAWEVETPPEPRAEPSEVACEPTATTYDDESSTPEYSAEEKVVVESVAEEVAPETQEPLTIADLWRTDASEEAEEPVAPSKPEPEPQVSFIERFAHLVPEDDEPIRRPAPVASVPTAIASNDDESIDDYMRKLMQRVRGSSTNEDTPAPAKKQPTIAAAISEMAVESRESTALAEAAEPAAPNQELIRDLTELRRGPAPEQMTNMGALRQLANQSARHAIDVAASRQSREKATMRLTVSVISVAVGTLASILAENPLDFQFIGGFTSVVVGGWFFVRTVKQCQVRTLDEQIARAAKHAG